MPDRERIPQPAALTLDFSNVGDRREGGRAFHGPEGDYLFKVVGYEIRKKKEENTQYISWKCQPIKPEKYENKGFCYHITSLKPESLWQVRNFLEDLGLKVPKSALKVPLKQIVEKGLIFGGTVEDDLYNPEKPKSKIVATFKKADYEETVADDEDEDEETEEEEEEAEETPKAKPKTKKPEPEEEEEEEEEEDLEELDVDDI